MFKKCKVVMLPTKEKAENFPILKNVNGRGDKLYVPAKGYYYTQEYLKEQKFEAQHLYIISDDKIEDGDWFFSAFYSYLIQNTKEWRDEQESRGKGTSDVSDLKFHKIIATTDKSLTIKNACDCGATTFEGCSQCLERLPQPSESFVQKYIEAYNKGEIITDVLVEYEKTMCSVPFESAKCRCVRNEECHNPVEKLKINYKDNTITIRKEKDSWSREEIVDLLYRFGSHIQGTEDVRPYYLYDKWVDENL